jgi:hypothetical protein
MKAGSAALAFAIALALGGVAFWRLRATDGHPAPESEPAGRVSRLTRGPGGEIVVALDPAAVEAAGIRTAPLEGTTRRRQVVAFGRLEEDPSRGFTLRAPVPGIVRAASGWPKLGDVLSDGAIPGMIEPRLTPVERIDLAERLAATRAERDALTASLVAARAAYERARTLNADQQSVSDRVVQEAEARVRSEEARLRAATENAKLLEAMASRPAGTAPLEVHRGGEVVEVAANPGESVEAGAVLLRLARYDRLLARVEILPHQEVDQALATARIVPLGHDDLLLPARRVSWGASASPGVPAATLVLECDPGPLLLRPGGAVRALLDAPGGARPGVIVPRSAVARYLGKTWVYVQAGEARFARRELAAEEPDEGGWFVASGFAPADRVVVTGAQILLSEELRSRIPGDEEAPLSDVGNGDGESGKR